MNIVIFLLLASSPWIAKCEQMIGRELTYSNPTYLSELLFSIPNGIHLANLIQEKDTSDQDNLNRCALLLAISKRESTFNPIAKNGTSRGLYQITPTTAKDILKDLFLIEVNVKEKLFRPLASTVIVNLLLDRWFLKYKTLRRVLVRYNCSQRISQEIIESYNRIRRSIQ